MGHVFIGYGNATDRSVFTGGSWQPTLPLTNLQSRELGIVARTTDVAFASTTFDVDLQDMEQLRAVALVNHNSSLDGQLRVTISETSDHAEPAWQSDVLDFWPAVYPIEELDFEAPNWWSGQYLVREIAATTPIRAVIVPGSPVWGRFVRVEVFDAGNPAGYFEVGRTFIGGGFQPEVNMLGGASIGINPATTFDVAASGAMFFDRKRSRRRVKITLDHMSHDAALANVFEMLRQEGVDGEFLFAWDPDEVEHALRRTFLAHLPDPGSVDVEFPWDGRATAPLTFQELL